MKTENIFLIQLAMLATESLVFVWQLVLLIQQLSAQHRLNKRAKKEARILAQSEFVNKSKKDFDPLLQWLQSLEMYLSDEVKKSIQKIRNTMIRNDQNIANYEAGILPQSDQPIVVDIYDANNYDFRQVGQAVATFMTLKQHSTLIQELVETTLSNIPESIRKTGHFQSDLNFYLEPAINLLESTKHEHKFISKEDEFRDAVLYIKSIVKNIISKPTLMLSTLRSKFDDYNDRIKYLTA